MGANTLIEFQRLTNLPSWEIVDAFSYILHTPRAADSLSVDELGEVLHKVCGWPQVPIETLKRLSALLDRPAYRAALADFHLASAPPAANLSSRLPSSSSFSSSASTSSSSSPLLPPSENLPFVDIGLFCGEDGMVDGMSLIHSLTHSLIYPVARPYNCL